MALFAPPKIAKSAHSICTRSFEIQSGAAGDFAASMVQEAGQYLESGDIRAAEKCLRMGLQKAPQHPQCLAYLAVCAAAGQHNLETAETLARKLTKDYPREAAAFYALGRVVLLAGNREAAFQHFQKARRLAGDDVLLQGQLKRIEPRRPAVLPFLSRDNPLNVALGRLRAALIRRGAN